jgi:hypothetical protein
MEYNYKTTSIPDHFLYSISEKDCTISKPLFVAESACFPQFPQIYLINLLTQGVLHRNHHHDLGARLLVSFSPQAKLLASRTASSSLISSVFSSPPLQRISS